MFMTNIFYEALKKGVKLYNSKQFALAKQIFGSILQLEPKHPDANYYLSLIKVSEDNFPRALSCIMNSLEVDPNNSEYWVAYIDILINHEAFDEAQQALTSSKANHIIDDRFFQLQARLNQLLKNTSVTTLGNDCVSQRKFNVLDSIKLDQAVKLAKKKEKEGSLNDAERIYCDILVRLPNNKKAKDGLKGLLGMNIDKSSNNKDPSPDQLQSLVNKYNQGNYQKVLEEVKQLRKLFANSLSLCTIQGAAYIGLNQFSAAIKSYKQAIKIKSTFAEAHYNLGIAYVGSGQLDLAIDSYSNAIKINPDDVQNYFKIANVFLDKGESEVAIKNYKQAVKIKPDFVEAYLNMGLAFRKSGCLESAIHNFKKVLSLKPNQSDAHNFLGVTLKDKGELEAAIKSYKQAIRITPNYAEAHNNMGLVFNEQGKFGMAIESFKQAIKIKPNYADAFNSIGVVFKQMGDVNSAIKSFIQAIKNNTDCSQAYTNIGICLKGVVIVKPQPDLQSVILELLTRGIFVRPEEIAKAAISLLKFESNWNNAFEKYHSGNFKLLGLEIISDLSDLPLLIKLMSVCALPDFDLERLLKDIRSYVLFSVSTIEATPKLLRFQSALALQCFTNEYIYTQTSDEENALAILESNVIQSLSNRHQPSVQSILCLASYKALSQYKFSDLLTSSSGMEEVFTRQILEPKQEEFFKVSIPALEEITDKVSSKVKEQYEASPYPRWINLGLRLNPSPIREIIKELQLRIFDFGINQIKDPDILICGCGTGQHSIETAQRFVNSRILAIDLSLTSLSYAKRKTEELGIKNIKYMQADILNLSNLDQQFDIVESSGVLHHMDSPKLGWKLLTNCLKPGGLMSIGLYSELARQPIIKMREEISKLKPGASDSAIMSFREDIINLGEDRYKQVIESSDFYSLSSIRDLLFHVQEHQFTIPQIKECLSELSLNFCGFEPLSLLPAFKLKYSTSNDPYNLDSWHSYELLNPETFGSMYQFWCQKV